MRSATVVVALATGLLPSVVTALTPPCDVCAIESVLGYLTQKTNPAACLADLADQATTWCRDYLSIEPVTVYLSTVTPILSETVIETSTTATTTTELTTTTTETTSTAAATEIVHTTVTATVSAQAVQRRVDSSSSAAPSCVDLATVNLLAHPASRLSKACSCLSPQPATVTLSVSTAAVSTATNTGTTVATEVVSETSSSTEVSVTVVTETDTLTSVSTATATIAPALGLCDVAYTGGGNEVGNTVQAVAGTTSARDCCQQCLAKPNCVASAYVGSACQHLVKTTALAGATVNAQCPLGVETYSGFGSPSASGFLYKGPCAA
ncbi:hypothetical protein CONLIGDRAFT_300447 [Coniochaeta ligniaria NRRL 30616]|uniref:Apple domain-containing protein n=1 Tax=Coniochaeta ligniaria NRRL 30616 TaxID=1408157 RepID=A0A1J7JML9_9PEZI|nr:hypothetical protein CONLIGDRAFT_300447 [Coniochaeta ligniaria NRRL 30616]